MSRLLDWKPMRTAGSGVREIRVRDDSGAFRVLYVAKFEDAVYVLHCFQKKPKQRRSMISTGVITPLLADEITCNAATAKAVITTGVK